MSKKAKTKPEASRPPESPLREKVPADLPEAGGPQEYLRPEEVEPADEGKWGESKWEESRWAP